MHLSRCEVQLQVFQQIIAELIAIYPHQCLWRSVALSRSNQSKSRRDRCLEVYELAKRLGGGGAGVPVINAAATGRTIDLGKLISQYTYLAESLIK